MQVSVQCECLRQPPNQQPAAHTNNNAEMATDVDVRTQHVATPQVATPPPACTRRLARDLRELQLEELITIAAEPLADDITVWRVSLTAPDGMYKGVPFHLVMTFPAEYPSKPPRVRLCTLIDHPNVFEGYDVSAGGIHEPGVWVCLNMLRDSSQGDDSGWSSAYSVCSILVALQSFLFAENVTRRSRRSVTEAFAFHEEHKDGFPAIDTGMRSLGDVILQTELDTRSTDLEVSTVPEPEPEPKPECSTVPHGVFDLDQMPEEVMLKIAEQLPPQAVLAMFRTCKAATSTLGRAQLPVRRELLCFYSKLTFTEENTVLGFGLNVERGGYQQGGGRHIKRISTELELLSYDAFANAGVRTSVNSSPFTHWLPVLLDSDHSEKALPLCKRSLMTIAGFDAQRPFDPLVALTVLPKLLNNMTVSLMSVNDATSLHASEKALLGFTSFHHLLLRLAADYPVIRERANFWVREFISTPAKRSKLVIHDLGELLVLLYLCPEGTWDTMSQAFLEESFVRNVRWIFDARNADVGELAVLEPVDSVSEYRLDRTLNATATSCRLLMFQAFFLLHVATPNGKSAADILLCYERNYGRPPIGTAAKLQATCRKILPQPKTLDLWGRGRGSGRDRVSAGLSWPQFFCAMLVPLPTKPQLCNILRQAIRRSEQRGYHSSASVDWVRLRKTRATRDKSFDRGSIFKVGLDCSSSDVDSDVWSVKSDGAAGSKQPTKIFIAGLQPWQTDKQLRELCCSFGNPSAVQKAANARHAFVFFASSDEADAALQYLREVTVAGRKLRVERSQDHANVGRRPTIAGGRRARAAKCPHPPQSMEASRWYKEHGRR
eukprot:COSAG06_NODE_3968_length_4710_cov_2.617870_2_plen_834_part_00